jgi:hypothetical protein
VQPASLRRSSVSGSVEGETTDRQALSRLERAVGELLEEVQGLRARSSRHEVRVRDLEGCCDGSPRGTMIRLASWPEWLNWRRRTTS